MRVVFSHVSQFIKEIEIKCLFRPPALPFKKMKTPGFEIGKTKGDEVEDFLQTLLFIPICFKKVLLLIKKVLKSFIHEQKTF
jgi:hypothetical protein